MCSLNNWLGWILLVPFQVLSIIKSGSQLELGLFCLLSAPQATSEASYQGIFSSTCGSQVQPQPHNRSFLEFKLQKKIFRPYWKQVDFNKTLFWLQKSMLSFSGSVRYDRQQGSYVAFSQDLNWSFGFHVICLKVWPLQPVRLALQTSLHPAGRLTAALMSKCCLHASPFRVDGGRSECRRKPFLK